MARIVAISFRGDEPKIGLTMRQPGLGKLEWIKDEKKKKQSDAKKALKAEEAVARSGGKTPKAGKKK